MIRLPARLLAVMATLVLVAGVPAAAQSDGELVLEGVDAGSFPLVRAVVTGPAIDGEPDDAFVVRENGEPVNADVVRIRRNDLNVVVALDVSGSMEGEPLAEAKAAIGQMLDSLPADVPVSIVTIGETAVVQSTFTTDREATRGTVDGLIAAGGTALFDGVATSLQQLEAQGGTGALVVLADGDDTTSDTTLEELRPEFAGAEVDAAFVALETEDFTPATFDALRSSSEGQLLTVGEAGGFGDALQTVSAGLGNAYEIRYRSASTGSESSLEIALASDPSSSVTTEFAHEASGEFVPDVATDGRVVGGAGIFASSVVPIVSALFVTIGGAILYLGFRNSTVAVERREGRHLQKAERKQERKRKVSGMQEALEGFSAHMLEANDRGRSLDDTLDRAGLSLRSNEFVVAVGAISIASLMVGVLLFGVPYFLIMLAVPVLVVPGVLKFLTRRRTKTFVTQLGDTLQLMAGSLRAGYGLGQTLDSVARETESPTSEEFQRVVMETRLGRSLEDALDAMSERIQAPDFDWVVDAIKIQASVGGDLGEIIEQVGETIRARVRIKRQVDALAAEGKISALVLFCLPFGLAFFIFTGNPDYIEPLISTGTGYVLLAAAATMLTVGGLWLKKLVNPEF